MPTWPRPRRPSTAVLGVDAVTNSRFDLEEAGAILVLGANLSDCDPVLALTVVQALRKNKPVIVVDPRRTELAGKAKYHVALKPGADLAVLRAMMKHILDVKLQDAAFIAANTEGFAALESLSGRCRHRRRSGRRRCGRRNAESRRRRLRPSGRGRDLRRTRS